MDLFVEADGRIVALHSDLISLPELGRMTSQRVSDIGWCELEQVWKVHAVADGTVLHQHTDRSQCVAWEVEFFNRKLQDGEKVFG